MSKSPAASVETSRKSRARKVFDRVKPWLPALIAVLLLVVALFALREIAGELDYREVLAQVHATPTSALLLCLGFTLLSFVALAGYDLSALAYLRIRLPWHTVAQGAFAGYAVGNTVGMGALSGGAVRLRVYGAAGMEPMQVAQLMGFISAGFGLGITFIGAIGLLWGADRAETVMGIPVWLMHGIGVFTLAFISWVIWLCAKGRHFKLFGQEITLPSMQLALVQVAVSALDLLFAATALWVLLPMSAEVSFMDFLAFYVIGVSLGVILHIPGGVGIFEAMIILAYGDSLPPATLAGALLLFRATYYLLPLALAIGLLLLREMLNLAKPALPR